MPGSVSETSFEQQLSNLAYAALQDRAPALTDYVLGFQLIDKDEEGSKGVGVFGLRIGKELAYVPAFYVNGELKGVDMLYAVGADKFVPLNEDWINYFIHRKPAKLGDGDRRTPQQRGVIAPRLADVLHGISGLRSPAISSLSKVAAAAKVGEEWAEAVPLMFVAPPHQHMDLPSALAELGPKMAAGFIDELRHNPKFAAAVLEHYTPTELASKVVEGNKLPNTNMIGTGHPEGTEAAQLVDADAKPVTVLTGTDGLGIGVTDEEREKLLAGERVVRDVRRDEDISKVYELEVNKSLSNPEGPGVYEVLMADGSFATTIVAEPKTYGIGKTNGVRLVIQPERKTVTSFWKLDILSRCQLPMDKATELLRKVGDTAKSPAVKDTGVWINDHGIATFPCEIIEKTTGTDGRVIFWVKPDYYVVDSYHRAWLGMKHVGTSRIPEDRNIVTEDGSAMDSRWKDPSEYSEIARGGEDRGHRVIIDASGSPNVRTTSSTTILDGEKFRWVPLEKRQRSVADYGTIADLSMNLGKFAGVEELKITTDGVEYDIDGPLGFKSRLTKTAAFKHLLVDNGLRAEAAEDLMSRATRTGFKCRIKMGGYTRKLAYGLDPSALDTQVYPDATGQLITSPQAMAQFAMPPDRSANQNLYGYIPGNEDYHQTYQRDASNIDAASKSGQKDVLDTSVIASLLRTNDVGDKIRKFVPSLIGALDKLCRTLFLSYWKYDEFEKQYGKQDAVEFEDNLKNVVENLGELVIFLHQKSMSGDPEGLGLGGAANSDTSTN